MSSHLGWRHQTEVGTWGCSSSYEWRYNMIQPQLYSGCIPTYVSFCHSYTVLINTTAPPGTVLLKLWARFDNYLKMTGGQRKPFYGLSGSMELHGITETPPKKVYPKIVFFMLYQWADNHHRPFLWALRTPQYWAGLLERKEPRKVGHMEMIEF